MSIGVNMLNNSNWPKNIQTSKFEKLSPKCSNKVFFLVFFLVKSYGFFQFMLILFLLFRFELQFCILFATIKF